jgi:pyridoxamine 5'-phosphate oxidase family protein
MAAFTEREREYLLGQHLARLATADASGTPHVVPVGFQLSSDGCAIDIGGHDVTNSKKWRDLKVNPRVAVVVDDLEKIDPWTPRGIEVRGLAELHDVGGGEKFGPEIRGQAWIRIIPKRVTTWGVEGHAFSPSGQRRSRTVVDEGG